MIKQIALGLGLGAALLLLPATPSAAPPLVPRTKPRPPSHLPTTSPLKPTSRVVGNVYRAVNGPTKTTVDMTLGARDGLRKGALGHICDRWEVKVTRVTRTRARGTTGASHAQIKRCSEVAFYLD